ncbi:MAG: hypothetical protein ACOYL6_18450 [Bacteriovoracaceae bacterium]
MKTIVDLIRVEDFKIFRFFIVAYNNTSGSNVVDFKKIELVSLTDTGFGITLPKNSCAIGHSLTFYIAKDSKKVLVKKLTNNQNLPGTIAVTAKVTGLGDAGDGFISCEMSLTNFTRNDWEGISKLYADRQEQINDLFIKLKKQKFPDHGDEEGTD